MPFWTTSRRAPGWPASLTDLELVQVIEHHERARVSHLASALSVAALLVVEGCAANPETRITPGLLAKTPVCLTLHWDHRPSPAGHAAPDTLILLSLDDDPQNYADTARAWGYASNATAWGRGAVAPTQGTAKVEDGCGG
jgi:hypothetical protein